MTFLLSWGIILAAFASTSPVMASNSPVATSTEAIQEFAASSFEGTPLLAITSCESGNGKGSVNQYDKKGNVLTHFNDNKTFDLGVGQINSVHLEEAARMGLNLNDPYDNIDFTLWLYVQQGTNPWKASSKCWQ